MTSILGYVRFAVEQATRLRLYAPPNRIGSGRKSWRLGNAAGCGWDTTHPPQNGARQIARYSRQIATGQKTAANGVL